MATLNDVNKAAGPTRREGPSIGRAILEETGEIARFTRQVLQQVPHTIRTYPAEIFRQMAILVLSSAAVIWAMEFVFGAEILLQVHYLTKQLGAVSYIGLVGGLADPRAGVALMWGWIIAAKVGTGFAAELGSMRINEEIDALEVTGVRPLAYLAATRMIGFWVAVPFLWFVGLGFMYLGSYLVAVVQLGSVSPGGFRELFWTFQSWGVYIQGALSAFGVGTLLVLVGCYYGYTAKGGPVGVGNNTARSMVFNMIIASVFTAIFYQLFFGTNIVMPITN